MPKKKEPDDPKAQRERFEKAVHELVDAGELDPAEAERKLDDIIRNAAEI